MIECRGLKCSRKGVARIGVSTFFDGHLELEKVIFAVCDEKKAENVLWLKKKPYICTRFTTVTAHKLTLPL